MVTTAGFVFGEQTIECNALEKMNVANGDIDSAYLYAFGIKDIDEKCWKKVHFLKKYYVECLMIAATDVLRDWIRSYIERKHSVRHKNM